MLKTKRLIIREYSKKDIEDLVKNINDLSVTKWLLEVKYPYTKKDALLWANYCAKEQRQKPRKEYDLAIALKQDNKIIGGVGVNHIDYFQGMATLGMWFGKPYHSKGYGSESIKAIIDFCFDKLKLRRLEAFAYRGNVKSISMIESCGFKLEGIKRKGARCAADGKIKDDLFYGLLKEEYKK